MEFFLYISPINKIGLRWAKEDGEDTFDKRFHKPIFKEWGISQNVHTF